MPQEQAPHQIFAYEAGTAKGVNSSIHPMRLTADALSYAVNVSMNGAIPTTRPAIEVEATFMANGKYQGAEVYHLSGKDYLVYAVSGSVYMYDVETQIDQLIIADALSATATRHHFCQCERYMVIQDGESHNAWEDELWPVIMNGSALVDQSAIPDYQRLPKGNQMAYAHGRIFVATEYIFLDSDVWSDNLGNVGFVAGDLIKSKVPEKILNFTETNYLNGGGRIIPTYEAGLITAMTVLGNNLSGTGEGPLVVSYEHGMAAFQVDANREQWFDIELGTIMYTGRGLGCLNDQSYAHSNNGLIYLSKDGLRTIHDTQGKAANAGVSNNPISAEVTDLLSLSSAVSPSVASAGSRIYMTGNSEEGTDYFRSLVIMNTFQIGSMTGPTTPIYEGEWTGYNFLQVIESSVIRSSDRVYIITQDGNDINLMTISDASPDKELPTCQMFTRYYDFDNPIQAKRLHSVSFNIMDIVGPLTFNLYYRTDGSTLWGKARSFRITANGAAQHIKSLVIPIEQTIDETTNGALSIGNRIQLCIEWEGIATVCSWKLIAAPATVPDTFVSESGSTFNLVPKDSLVQLGRYQYQG